MGRLVTVAARSLRQWALDFEVRSYSLDNDLSMNQEITNHRISYILHISQTVHRLFPNRHLVRVVIAMNMSK